MQNPSGRIRHTVVFTLKHEQGSAAEKEFFQAVDKLADLPGVQRFECIHQISNHSNYKFGISMEFDSKELYDHYTNHPEHVSFVHNRWMNEVQTFLELDFQLNE